MSRNSRDGNFNGPGFGPGFGPHGGGHFPGPYFPGDDRSFSFTFSTDNAAVQGMSVTHGTATRTLDITDSTFETTVGTNAKGEQAVLTVEQTDTRDAFTKTRIFDDADGDGQYVPEFSIAVATRDLARLGQHKFTFAADGSVTGDQVLVRNAWRNDAITSTEKYAAATVAGDNYVFKTVAVGDAYFFQVFRDDDADGIWTEIASGASSGELINTTTGLVDLVGIQDYLSVSATVVG